jgi:hypothetical protein
MIRRTRCKEKESKNPAIALSHLTCGAFDMWNDFSPSQLQEWALCKTMALAVSEVVFERDHIEHELCFRET